MVSCKKVAQLASESLDRSLTLQERLSLRFHLLHCNFCSRYVRQLKFLKRACANANENQSRREIELTEDARERIRDRLSQNR